MTKIAEVEKAIARILQQLEVDADVVVESIQTETLDVTKMGDDRPVYKMRIRIDTQRQPGREWL